MVELLKFPKTNAKVQELSKNYQTDNLSQLLKEYAVVSLAFRATASLGVGDNELADEAIRLWDYGVNDLSISSSIFEKITKEASSEIDDLHNQEKLLRSLIAKARADLKKGVK